MKADEATSNGITRSAKRPRHGPHFIKVLDGRKQPIRGLWVRNGRFYAQLNVENPVSGIKRVRRVPLTDKDNNRVETVAQAVTELKRLHTQRADDTLPVLGRQPKFADYAVNYLEAIQGAKKLGTIEKEKTILGRWTNFIGHLRLNQIKRVHINRFIDARLKVLDKEGKPNISPRTVNLDVIGLRVVLKRALEDGLIQRLPTEGLRPLKTTTVNRQLLTSAALDALCKAALGTKLDKNDKTVPVTENSQQFIDYLKLMAYCGARRNEALGVQWDDVDLDHDQLNLRRQVTHRGIEDLKNREQRTVDFNPTLKAHLLDMRKRRDPDLKWLFPSPQRGDKDVPAKSFQESLKLVRTAAKMPSFGFHDLRHHFASMCVMSGVDFMTIAAWMGHKDGGVLIGKVYAHLASEHRKAMAARVNLLPGIVESATER